MSVALHVDSTVIYGAALVEACFVNPRRFAFGGLAPATMVADQGALLTA